MIMKKTLSILLVAAMISMIFTAFPITANAVDVDASATAVDPENIFQVSNADELKNAKDTINSSGAGEYVIELTDNISSTIGGIDIKGTGITVTVIGNDHYFYCPTGQNVQAWYGATVILGDGKSELTLIGGDSGSEPGPVHIFGDNSVCYMNEKVTIKDNKCNNLLGGGVSVVSGTFIMNGGTIENCGIEGGYVCFGGGVAVYNGGYFEMNGGTIKNCYVESSPNDYGWQIPCVAGGGVFVNCASFVMNDGLIEGCTATNPDDSSSFDAVGGGVAVITSKKSVYIDHYTDRPNYGYLDSDFTMNGGVIKNCSADVKGGALAAGMAFADFDPMLTHAYVPHSGSSEPGIYLNGGSMIGNDASEGGAIFLNWIRPNISVNINNMLISSNTAYNGAGIEVYSYWTQAVIDGCTITNNKADNRGGGIDINNNDKYTNLKNTVITDNTSGVRGAGVSYSSHNSARFYISGANIIQNNTYNGKQNNLNILSLSKPVYVNGDLTGSQIGLSDPTLWDDGKPDEDATAVSTEYLTSGYRTYNPEVHPKEYFTSDHETWIVDRSEQTKEETVDPSSVTYREYTVNRYPYIPASDPKLNPLYGQNNEYVYSEIKNPDIDKISSFTDLYNEMKYKYSDTSKYTKSTDVNNNGNIYLRYSILDSTYPTTLTIQKTSSNNYATVVFSQSPMTGKGGSVTYRVYLNDQTLYADTKELVYKVFDTTNNISNSNYSYAFSEDYTTISIKYVNSDPPADTIYEYDDYGNLTAKLEIVGGVSNYTLKQKTTEIITGNTDEVRLVHRTKIDYHINNADIIDASYDDGNPETDDDIFTSYVEAATKEVKVGETIDEFYTIPEVTPTKQNSCPYILNRSILCRQHKNSVLWQK